MRYRLRWRFLTKLAVVCVLAAIAIHFAHRWQVRKQVGAFLHQADLARERGEFDREITYLHRYLAIRPDDSDARERLGRLLCSAARTDRELTEGFYILDDVLRRDPERDQLRRFAAEVAIHPRLAMFKEARGHIQILMAKSPNDGVLEGLLARCLVADKKFDGAGGAEEYFEKSIAHRSDLIDSYAGLAYVRRHQLQKPRDADKTIDALVQRNPNSHRAHLVAAEYWRNLGRLPQVETMLDRAWALAPDELDVQLARADWLRIQARQLARDRKRTESDAALGEARRLLQRAIEKHGAAPAPYLTLASLENEARNSSRALAAVSKALASMPDSLDLLVCLLECQFLLGDADGASATLGKLRDRGLPQSVFEFERARVMTLKRNWLEAARLIARVSPDFVDRPPIARQAGIVLSRCLEELGDHSQKLAVCQRILTQPSPLPVSDPMWSRAMLGVAEAQSALGLVDDSLTTYRKMKEWAPGAWIPVARLEFIKALSAPDPRRDWSPVEEAIAAAQKAHDENIIVDATEIRLLRASLLHYRGKSEEARKLLQALESEHPKNLAVRIERAMQAVRERDHSGALAILAAAETELGDRADLSLTRARVWVEMKAPNLGAKLLELAAGGQKLDPLERSRLLRGLAEIAAAAGLDEASRALWNQLAPFRPYDLGVHMARFDRAIRAGDFADAARIIQDIADVDGERGQFTRLAQSIHDLQRSRSDRAEAARNSAIARLTGMEQEVLAHPLAGRVALSLGLAYDLGGQSDLALEKYKQAIECGENNPHALRRMLELYAARGRYVEAQAVLDKLPPATRAGADLQRLAAEMSLQVNHREEAIRQAENAVGRNPESYADRIWLGRMLWSAGEKDRSIEVIKKATELKPEAMDGWLILMSSLLTTNRLEEAARTFDAAAARIKPPDNLLFHALGNSLLGRVDSALEAFQRARHETPTSSRVLFLEADYLLQLGRLTEAREGFRRVLASPSASAEDQVHARQRLALATAADPDYSTSQTALETLDGSLHHSAAGAGTPARRRARAVVLAMQRNRTSKLEAISLLEENPQGRTAGEQFLLAQLHHAVGNRTRVPVVMADLLKTERNRIPLYLAYFAMWLLRYGDVREAEEWIRIAVNVDPASLTTAELKARLAAAKNNPTEARSALLQRAEAPGAPVGVIARICEDIGLHDDAERLLKRVIEEKRSKQPEVALSLAAFYGRRGRTVEGIQLCEAERGRLPVLVVGEAAVQVLYHSSSPSERETARVASWLTSDAARAAGQERAVLQQLLASVRNLQGDYAAAAELYKQAISANPRDALALNNLAFLHSAREKRHDPALTLIDQARKLIGPNPNLLDTEALIRLNKGQADVALSIMSVVVAEAPSGAAYFHLAQIHLALKDETEARRAWRQAGEHGLKEADLHPLERTEYRRLALRFQ